VANLERNQFKEEMIDFGLQFHRFGPRPLALLLQAELIQRIMEYMSEAAPHSKVGREQGETGQDKGHNLFLFFFNWYFLYLYFKCYPLSCFPSKKHPPLSRWSPAHQPTHSCFLALAFPHTGEQSLHRIKDLFSHWCLTRPSSETWPPNELPPLTSVFAK